jgi:hypothetical protein
MVMLSDRYLLGSGAMHAKHARLWLLQTARLLVSVAQRWAWGRPRINYLREPLRLPRLLALPRNCHEMTPGFGQIRVRYGAIRYTKSAISS